MKEQVVQNLQKIENRIQKACDNSGRSRDEVQLLLATKTVDVHNIKYAVDAGYPLIGENKIQEVRKKYDSPLKEKCRWHMIGHLQSNKVKFVTKYIDVLQSVDRMKVVRKLSNRLEFDDRDHIDIFIQVNTSFEDSKFGVPPQKVIEFIKQVSEYPRLHIKGVMTIGILSSKDEKVRDCFKLLKEIQQKAQELNLPSAHFDQLSMGMSNDLELAIEEGSTMIRVGTAIFGKRPYPDSYYWDEGK